MAGSQRIHEKLVEEEQIQVSYSTLTRILRGMDWGPPRATRCDHVPDEPGAEMQHDTTVYRVKLADQPARLIASLLYLRYSKCRYLKFYHLFNRFRMKCFLHEALMHWGYAAPRCIIDNTNLARLRGCGRQAVIVPEMVVLRCALRLRLSLSRDSALAIAKPATREVFGRSRRASCRGAASRAWKT